MGVLRTSSTFSQLEVRDDSGAVVVDLVADPTPIAEPPRAIPLGATTILVDTPHQLLVNKLCALLSRSELRDLIDVRELLGRNHDGAWSQVRDTARQGIVQPAREPVQSRR